MARRREGREGTTGWSRLGVLAVLAPLMLAGCTVDAAGAWVFQPTDPAPEDPRLIVLDDTAWDALPDKAQDAIERAMRGERATIEVSAREQARLLEVVQGSPCVLQRGSAFVGCYQSTIVD